MMSAKKALTLSIIIPAYNEEAYIVSCLAAIARQTVTPDEVIVVDNNSTDATVDLARRFPFVQVIHEPTQGVLAARKRGFDSAIGDIIARIDADTIMSETWVAHVHGRFENTATQAISGPNGYHDFILPRTGLFLEHVLLVGARLLGHSFLFGCNMAMRRTAWNTIRRELCMSTRIFEDIDIADHLLAHGIRPTYDKHMAVMVSSRRVASSFADFNSYIGAHVRTARRHHQPVLAAYYAQTMFIIAYCIFKPWHSCYDPVRRRFSLRYGLGQQVSRPNPMAMTDIE